MVMLWWRLPDSGLRPFSLKHARYEYLRLLSLHRTVGFADPVLRLGKQTT